MRGNAAVSGNVLGLKAHADQACREIFEAGDLYDQAEDQGRMNGARILKDTIEDAVRKDLKRLGSANRFLPILLHLTKVMRG